MAEEIKIVVGADTSKLQAELKKAENELKAFQTQLNNTGDSKKIDELNKKIAETNNVIANIKTQIPPIELTVDNSQLISGVAQAENIVESIPPIQVPISADTTQLISGVAQAENIVESIPPIQVPITADATQLIAGVAAAENQAQNIPPVNVPITIDVKQISAQLTLAENDLRAFTSELKSATNTQDVIRLQNSIGLLKTKIGDLKSSLGAADSGLKKVAGQTNSAAYAVTNLSRIVSDSAFGFIGIANNITPFIDSLAAAKKEAAATGTSLGKNLLSSLSGPGGLSLAFAAVTTAITFAQIGFQAWTGRSKEAKNSTKDLADELKSAEQGAIAQGVKLEGLVSVIQNVSRSERDRNAALKEANNLLEPYGKKIDSINISVAKAKELTDLYTEALINQAVGVKLADKIAELRLKRTDLENQKIQQQSAIIGANSKKLSEANALTARQYGTSDRAALNYLQTTQNVSNEQNKLVSINSDLVDINKQLNSLTAQYTATLTNLPSKTDKAANGTETLAQALAKFRKSLEATQATGISLGTPQFEINQDKIKEFEGILKKIIEKFNVDPNNKIYLGLEAELQNIQYENLLLKLKKNLDNAAKAILLPWDWKPKTQEEAIPNIAKNIKPIKIPVQIQADLQAIQGSIVPPEFVNNIKDELKGSAAEISKAWKDYSTQIDNAATGFLTDAASNIAIKFGEALGAALTGGNFGDVFSGVFELLAGGIQSLGEQLIKIGFLAVIAQQAIAQLLANPFAAIAVGIAMVALGAALKNLKTQQRFATGTRYAPGGMALVGERGPEMINLPRGSQVIPAAQTSQMMGGMGGQVEVFGVLRGQDIYFSNKKYGQTYGRTT